MQCDSDIRLCVFEQHLFVGGVGLAIVFQTNEERNKVTKEQ